MRSIRRSLAKWLVLWLSLLWATSGVGVYSVLRSNFESNLDRNLETLADKARIADQRDGGITVRFVPVGFAFPTTNPDVPLFEPGSNFFYQAWDASSGRMVAQSNNLGSEPLSWRNVESGQRMFWNDYLPGVGAIRSVGLKMSRRPFGGREPVRLNLVVANDRVFVDGRLGLLVMTLVIASVFGAITTWIVVRSVVNRGLSPLEDLGNQLIAMDPQHLQLQYFSEDLPVELQPVSRALLKLVERMDESFERERRFSGDVAHEFRTPIAELRAMAEVAIRWPHRASADDYREMLSISMKMEEAIEVLLELSRVEGGSAVTELSPLPLQAEILKCWDSYSDRAAAKDIVLYCDVAESDIIHANAGMLEMILKNLLENAVEYSPAGEKIVVSLELKGDQTGWLAIENLATNLESADVEHLFERFWRSDDSRTGVKHTGLGLSLAYSCAQTMGMELKASLNDTRELTIRLGCFTVEELKKEAG